MRIVTSCLDRTLIGMVVSLLALGLLAACAPALGASHASSEPSAQAAKKGCKKSKKRAAAAAKKGKCKTKKPVAPVSPPASAGGPPPPPPPPPPPQTAYEKIDAAIAAGEITAEQGLTYKVFEAFGDPRLPGQFAGGLPDSLAEAPLDQVTARWNQLSAATQAILGPFLIPPMHEGSYWQQQIQGTTSAETGSMVASATAADADPDSPWCATSGPVAFDDWSFLEASVGTAAGKVRIWYQDRYAATDLAKAGTLMSAMESKIWPALTALMGREPLPDFGSTGVCAGGSDAVDIALVDANKPTTTPTLRQENSPAHMVFPRSGSAGSQPHLAHEFLHMIQYSYTLASGDLSSGENLWLREGTAQWAMDYVSSAQYGAPALTPNNTEHQALQYFFPIPEKSLDYAPDYHDYGSYVFWLWAVRKGNNAQVVRQVWDAAASQNSLNAAKSLFGGGWAQAWKDFTKANWNQDPVEDYKNWDQVNDTAKEAARGDLPNSFSAFNVFVDPVAAKYLTFLPADDVDVLTYRNVAPLNDEAGVQAIITYEDGSHATEDWTQKAQEDIALCNVEELTLVFSNASITPGDGKLFPITWTPPSQGGASQGAAADRAANVCIPEPQGGFSGTAHYDDTVTTVVDWSWNGNVVFKSNGQANPWFPEFFGETWDEAIVESGSVMIGGQGTVQAGDDECTIDIPQAPYSLEAGDGTMQIQPGPEPHYGIQLHFPGDEFPMGTISCPDEDPFETMLPVPGLVFTEDAEQAAVRGAYQGASTFSNAFFTQNMMWNFSDPED